MTKSIRVTIQSFCSLFMLSALTLAPSSSAFAKKSKAHSRSAQPAVSLVDIPTSDSELAKKISARLHKMVEASKLNSADLGIWVGRTAEQGLETLYSHDAGRSMIPASLSKLATLATVLHELRPGYKFKTQLMSDAQIESGKLMGSIYLVGGGDPSFVSEDMWLLVNDLTHAGITSIDGDVVVDDSRFDKVRFGPDRQKERVDRAYDAPIGAMSMNWNSVNIYARPGDSVGEKLRVSVDVTTPYLTIKNETKTVASGHGQNVSVERATAKNGMGEEITIRGSMARGQPEVAIFKSITSPDLFSGYNLIEFLKQRGISVKGGVKLGKTPASGQVLATFEGKPLAHVVTDMAKWSNNFVAEMLVKNLSAEAGETPGTMDDGIARVRAFLETMGIKKGEYEFVNAAGFTRANKLSPLQIGRILETMHNDFTAFPEFVAALPIAGVDGTLRKRMIGTEAERWVRAKTGLLTGVVGLAGFAGRAKGSVLTFAFMYNGAQEDAARSTFDKLAAALAEE